VVRRTTEFSSIMASRDPKYVNNYVKMFT
jgi:hypothetical protein